jgi:hypothetical protein
MAIKRYKAEADTTISNAFKQDLVTRATGSNMGASDILEVFSIYGQISGSTGKSLEKSRGLLKFSMDQITTDRSAGTIPVSGSVNFVLKLYNTEHSSTAPKNYDLAILPVSESWSEGNGMDMDEYRDSDYADWEMRTSGSSGVLAWGGGLDIAKGGTYHTGTVADSRYSAPGEWRFTKSFGEDVTQDLEIDVTPLVEHWIAGTLDNNGVGIMLSGSYEDGTDLRSYYTKKFFARTSEFFFKRPALEARWDSSLKDDRSNFYASSSLATTENINTVYLYNYLRGGLANITDLHSSETLVVKLYRDAITDNVPVEVTGGLTSDTGIYTASFALDTTASVVYDVWSTGSTEYFTGTLNVQTFGVSDYNPNQLYVTSIPNLKSSYSRKETARFRFFTRKQNWSPTIYTKATETLSSEIVDSAYYKIFRLSDNHEVIPYGTGSYQYTKMSYDRSGSYFDFDMSMLQGDYAYGLSVTYYLNGRYIEQPEVFKFRVEG